MKQSNWQPFGVTRAPSSIIFGSGQRHVAGWVAMGLGKRLLICTDERLAKSSVLEDLVDSAHLPGMEISLFSETQPELPSDAITDCYRHASKFNPDVIVGIGGGSCLDMAKLVSLLLAHGGKLEDYYGELKVPGPTVPVVAIPTTSGTGSEVTPVAVLGDSSRDLKVGISSPYLIPHTAICDPELTLTCPPGLTATAGADALTHAIEAYTAVRHEPKSNITEERVFVGKNVLSDGHALSAIELLSKSLRKTVSDGSDIAARTDVMLGSLLAGLAFGSAGTAAAHAIQYPVGALTNTAHGIGVATLMPYVMRFNKDACENDYRQIARIMKPSLDPDNVDADDADQCVQELFDDIGIPKTLADLGLEQSRLDWVAEKSMTAVRLVSNNPRELTQSGASEIVNAAFYGRNT